MNDQRPKLDFRDLPADALEQMEVVCPWERTRRQLQEARRESLARDREIQTRTAWLLATFGLLAGAFVFLGPAGGESTPVQAASLGVPALGGAEGTDPARARAASSGERGGMEGLLGVVADIRGGDYRLRSEVAAGRFLQRFDTRAFQLDHVDMGATQVLRRSAESVTVEAVYRVPGEPEQTAELRFVKRDARWKIERFKVLGEARSRWDGASETWKTAVATHGSPRPGVESGSAQGSYRLFSDVVSAFDEGERSGLVSLQTTGEWKVFESWRAIIWSRGRAGIPTLAHVGEERDGSVLYRVSFGQRTLGVVRLKRTGRRWVIVGVDDDADPLRSSSYRRSVLRAFLSQ